MQKSKAKILVPELQGRTGLNRHARKAMIFAVALFAAQAFLAPAVFARQAVPKVPHHAFTVSFGSEIKVKTASESSGYGLGAIPVSDAPIDNSLLQAASAVQTDSKLSHRIFDPQHFDPQDAAAGIAQNKTGFAFSVSRGEEIAGNISGAKNFQNMLVVAQLISRGILEISNFPEQVSAYAFSSGSPFAGQSANVSRTNSEFFFTEIRLARGHSALSLNLSGNINKTLNFDSEVFAGADFALRC